MDDVLKILRQVLQREMTPETGCNRLEKWFDNRNEQRERSLGSCAYRLCRALAEVNGGHAFPKSGWKDVAGHLRQVILMHKQRLPLAPEWVSELEQVASECGLQVLLGHEVDAERHLPEWFGKADDLRDVYELANRRRTERVLGDGVLYRMTGFHHYASVEQKALIQANLRLPGGHTLLACMPTGGGKSLIGQLVSFYETEGGRLYGGVGRAGTTLVIVPTTALALDQVRASRAYFTDETDKRQHRIPYAYHSNLSAQEKELIFEGVEQGTIPLLYTSPEAVINGPLHVRLLQAAKQGKLQRIVIDEAHIVADWGGLFRTDFQVMSAFRRKLLEASGGALKTLLLSATLTDRTSKTLRNLFSEADRFVEFRADALRYEPIFFVDRPRSEKQREERLLEIIPLLPRPIILYVTSPDRAVEWQALLKNRGLLCVETFTGETANDRRETLLARWNRNEIDIMVATSAFGMGVDKKDVRTVIHACLPESINRFYQEIGRGGRDGYASISLASVVLPQDHDEAFSLINKLVPTVKLIVERWTAMRLASTSNGKGDEIWIRMGVQPAHLQHRDSGRQNANWNEVVLLFLCRKGLLEILDVQKEEGTRHRKLLVRILQSDLMNDPQLLEAALEQPRDREWTVIKHQQKVMEDLIRDADKSCLGVAFARTYPFTAKLCGGCPACRQNGRRPHFQNASLEVEGLHLLEANQPLYGVLQEYAGRFQELLLYPEAGQTHFTNLLLKRYLDDFFQSGIRTFVLPNLTEAEQAAFVAALPQTSHGLFFEWEELRDTEHVHKISGPVAILYPEDPREIDWLYKWEQRYKERSSLHQIVHLASRELSIPSEGKMLMHLVEGVYLSVEHVQKQQEQEADWL